MCLCTAINKSLSALGNVVNAMFYERPHVPYRDSKLTRMLKNSFTGNCKTLLIATIAPTASCYDEVHTTAVAAAVALWDVVGVLDSVSS